jgi:hypothetical protein
MHTPFVLWATATVALATAVGLAWWLWRQARRQLSHATLLAVLDVYKRAWEQQDAALILTIFREEGEYFRWKADISAGIRYRIEGTILSNYLRKLVN